MTKTRISMKWLVLALALIIVVGAVALTLSLRAHAEDDRAVFRVIISPRSADGVELATQFARENGWIKETEKVRYKTTFEGDEEQTEEPVFRFENPQLFGAYGLSSSATYTGDYRNLRKFLSDNQWEAADFNPEIMVYVLDDVAWCNSVKTTFSVLDTYQTLTNVEKSFDAVPLTLHFIGVPAYNDGEMPNMYVALSNNYSPIKCNTILDGVNLRGACKSGDADKDNVVYKVGYTAEGGYNTGRYATNYLSAVYASGCTLEVKNGAGIYNGNATGDAKFLTRVLVAAYSNAYVNKTVGANAAIVNTMTGDQTTVGNVILRSGAYGNVQAMGNGKIGIKTLKMTENFPEEEYTDAENMKGYYYDYPNVAALEAGDRSDTSRWYEYDYNAGAADAHVVIGGDEVGACHVDFINVGNASGDTQLGAGAHLILDVEDGATVKNFRPGPLKGVRAGDASKNIFNLIQFGTVEVNIKGGNIDGTGKNKYFSTSDNANGFSGVGCNAGVTGYTGSSAPTYGQAHSYINYTVNITGGTFSGNFYALMESDSWKSTPANNAFVQHGDVTFNIGNEDGTGPVFKSTTFRVVQGSIVIAPECDFEFNFNGGVVEKQMYYGIGACVYNTARINLNGGYINEAVEGFVAEAAFGEQTEMTESFTGTTVNLPLLLTVDGATIGQYYGSKGGTTNVSSVFSNTSAMSVLKSGVIGSVYMFADAGQSGRMGGSDSTMRRTAKRPSPSAITTPPPPSIPTRTRPTTASVWASSTRRRW